MSSRESYIREKLGAAVSTLATSLHPIQKRLEHAALSFITLQPKDFIEPEDQEAFAQILDELTSVKIDSERGYMGETLSRMDDEDASALAGKIVELYTKRMYALGGDDAF